MYKNVLVTGGAGFIGSNFIPYFCEKYPDYHVINLDKLTYAGNLDNLKECENFSNYSFIKGDICDTSFVLEVFEKHKITDVIHFAAESHVDNSISNPRAFIETNVLGTFTLLETFRKKHKNSKQNRFHHISTDEVYGTLGETGYFSEKTAYAPNSPYSASKAGSDMLVRAYFHTYGVNVVTSNCSNNYGPKQHSEKLIPTIIRHALAEEPIPIYGDGMNVRDWIYVIDHCKAVNLIFHGGIAGEIYNIGGHNEQNNLGIAQKICEILDQKYRRKSGSYCKLITFVTDRPGHDRRYAIDATKLKTELGWKAEESFDSGIIKTVEWYSCEQRVVERKLTV
ncbi:MAG: dTDP-glucose 4,6-dehydratase [Holosporaceae bacterium]|jgi:dTDP-glucose 4,6-dehydratase|nr:dTDP-glucose 4,6-dehydratase [Holosporaceae bacterium]